MIDDYFDSIRRSFIQKSSKSSETISEMSGIVNFIQMEINRLITLNRQLNCKHK